MIVNSGVINPIRIRLKKQHNLYWWKISKLSENSGWCIICLTLIFVFGLKAAIRGLINILSRRIIDGLQRLEGLAG
jgi:hypothetical protein